MKSALEQVQNLYHVGAYNAVLNAVNQPLKDLTPLERQLCQVYKVKSLLASSGQLSKADMAQLPSDTVQLLEWHAQLLNADSSLQLDVDHLFSQLQAVNVSNALIASLAAELYLHLDKTAEAFDVLVPFAQESLECCFLLIQCLLRLNRHDLAERQLEGVMKLKDADGDLPLVQLAQSAIQLCKGRDGCQDAFYTYQELLETFGMTSKLLTCQAVTLMSQLRLDEAEHLLQDALSKNTRDADALACMITCCLQMNKHGQVEELTKKLKSVAPNHPLIRNTEEKSVLFDQLSMKYRK